MSDSIGVSLALGLIKTFVCAYDIITFPVYLLIQRPWKRRSSNQVKAKQVDSNDIYSGMINFSLSPFCVFQNVKKE